MELSYANDRDIPIIPCLLEKDKPSDWLGLLTAGRTFYDFSSDSFEQTLKNLIKYIQTEILKADVQVEVPKESKKSDSFVLYLNLTFFCHESIAENLPQGRNSSERMLPADHRGETTDFQTFENDFLHFLQLLKWKMKQFVDIFIQSKSNMCLFRNKNKKLLSSLLILMSRKKEFFFLSDFMKERKMSKRILSDVANRKIDSWTHICKKN